MPESMTVFHVMLLCNIGKNRVSSNITKQLAKCAEIIAMLDAIHFLTTFFYEKDKKPFVPLQLNWFSRFARVFHTMLLNKTDEMYIRSFSIRDGKRKLCDETPHIAAIIIAEDLEHIRIWNSAPLRNSRAEFNWIWYQHQKRFQIGFGQRWPLS